MYIDSKDKNKACMKSLYIKNPLFYLREIFKINNKKNFAQNFYNSKKSKSLLFVFLRADTQKCVHLL